MDENWQARFIALWDAVEALVAHLAEDGSLSADSYDIVWRYLEKVYTPPQYPDTPFFDHGIPTRTTTDPA